MRWLPVLLAVLVGCGPQEDVEPARLRQPIVGGSEDAGALIDDVFLVAMTFAPTAANAICSGTLIAPRSIVTAAHCVDPARQAGATSVTIRVTHKPTDQMLMSSDLINVLEYRLHPSWNAAQTSATFDIAMLLLAAVPAGVTPRAINRAPLTGLVGQPIRLVGYGRTLPATANSGIRRVANATLTAFDANSFDFGSAGTLGICSGDSGGPGLHTFPDLVERIIGVHSLITSASCGSGTDSRIDFHQAFIDTWLAQKEDGGVDAGPPDAGQPDAGPPDAGPPDAGAADAGLPDAGPPDAGPPDAGPPDAGTPDAGTIDSGSMDAGAPDSGTADAGLTDGGLADAGASVDAGEQNPTAVGGCGCNSGHSESLVHLFFLLLMLARLRHHPMRALDQPGSDS